MQADPRPECTNSSSRMKSCHTRCTIPVEMNRREIITTAAIGACSGGLLAPVQAIAADVKAIRIKNVESFNIEIPATPTEVEAGVMNRINVTRVVTESGVRGYSFGGAGGVAGAR